MDTSEIYIKMSDCPEIQDKAPRKPYTTDLYSVGEIIMTYTLYRPEESQYDAIWLPRQDQLQEMAIPKDEEDSRNKYIVLLDDFQDWVLNDCSGLDWSHKIPVTMEQLWMAFVMKEKHNKVWDGSKWQN